MPDFRGEIRRRLAPLALAPEREAEIVEELALHLEDRFAERRGRGTSEDAALRDALDELSGHESLAEALSATEREAPPREPAGTERGTHWWANVLQDLRFGSRQLRSRPLFTLVAVATLALGIGANSAMFSVVDTVILRPLPYPESGRLVTFWVTAPEKGLPIVQPPEGLMTAYAGRSRTMVHLGGYSSGGATLAGTGEGDPERVNATAVTADFFTTVGIAPALGRTFLPAELAKGAPSVAVISHRLWLRRFAGDPTLVGRSVDMSSEPATIVGIMPPAFDFPDDADVWFPLPLDATSFSPWYLSTVGRMKAGVTPDDVRREIASLTDDVMAANAPRLGDLKMGATRAVAMPLQRELVGDARAPLLVLLAAVALVLLIATANIANLLLARAAARSREIAVRCCIGASPRRIAAQLLTESLLLSAAGAAAGLLLASWAVHAVRTLPLGEVPRLAEVHLDARVVAFTCLVTLAAGMLFGLAPALRAARVDPYDALREGTRAGAGAGSRRLMSGFVVSQFALSVILLVGAGLMLRSFRNLESVDPGFRPEHVLVTRVWLPMVRYTTDAQASQAFSRLVDKVSATPGVAAAGLNDMVPFSRYNPQDEFTVEGKQPAHGDPVPVADVRRVSPAYFDAIGTQIVRGRPFRDTDDDRAPLIAIVDESLARRYWPGEDPIGRRVREGSDSSVPWLTVVGVAERVKHRSLAEHGDYFIYLPFFQRPAYRSYLIVRTSLDPEGLIPSIRRSLSEIDPTLPMSETHTMEAAVAGSLGTQRVTNTLLVGFALVALLLAAIGIYGVMSLNVTGRSHEFGVRLALGAAPRDVLALVLRQGLVLAAIGVAVGVAGSLWLTRFLSTLLFGVGAVDPETYLLVIVVLAAAASLASYVPARRATREDPVAALRQE